MKKLLLAACAALMLTGVSCSNGSDNTDKMPAALSDSLSIYSGKTLGASVLSDYLSFTQRSDKEYSKQDIMKGIQLAFANADSESVLIGVQTGAQLVANLKQLENEGVEIDYSTFLKYFREQFMADEFDPESLANDNGVMNSLYTQMQAIKEEREAAAHADELQSATEAAAKYIADLKAEDPEIQTTESGLSYKIIYQGEEPRVSDNSMVRVFYKGTLIDGTVFDQTGTNPASFTPAGVVPGFAEGLKLLGKGGKAVLYIPGELAYGPKGMPQAGIGPNAMLIFDVEVADIINP